MVFFYRELSRRGPCYRELWSSFLSFFLQIVISGRSLLQRFMDGRCLFQRIMVSITDNYHGEVFPTENYGLFLKRIVNERSL